MKPKLITDLGMVQAGASTKKRRFGIYECPSCGNPYRANTSNINAGKSTQCTTCSKFKHGHSGGTDRLYNIWLGMKSRCSNKNFKQYCDYGGRGITVCRDWRDDYIKFRDWSLLNGYDDNLSIDRKDNDGNYGPSNCRWSTREVQSRNSRVIYSNNTSGFKGVVKNSSNDRWSSRLDIDGKRIQLGTFDYPWTAAIVRDSYIMDNNTGHTLSLV